MKRDDGSRAEAHSESLWKSQRTLMCARVNSIPTVTREQPEFFNYLASVNFKSTVLPPTPSLFLGEKEKGREDY